MKAPRLLAERRTRASSWAWPRRRPTSTTSPRAVGLIAALGVSVGACSPQREVGVDATPPATASLAVSSQAPPLLPTEPGIYYSFDFASDLSSARAEVCFVGPLVPTRLVPPVSAAAPLLRGARRGRTPLTVEDGAISLASVASGDCIAYALELTPALAGQGLRDGAGRVGDDALLSPDWWLWAPEVGDSDGARPPVYARVHTEGGPRPELPWPHRARGAFDRHVPPSAFVWMAQGAFARRPARQLPLGDSVLDVTTLGADLAHREAPVFAWLEASAKAVTTLLGGFPLPRAQVLLVADANRKESFGFVLRGGGPSATLLLPAEPSDAHLAADWTAVHELLHFGHPPVSDTEAWFSEGLATYLTAVARARAGLTSRRYGWWELLDGFERGRKVGTGVTLREECASMRKNHTYWRVYWSGAAMFLHIDVALHKRGQSLEAVVSKLARSALDDAHKWTADELVGKLDALSGSDIAARLTAPHLDSTTFPATESLAAALGVKLANDQSVTYDESAPDAAIRRAIMGGD